MAFVCAREKGEGRQNTAYTKIKKHRIFSKLCFAEPESKFTTRLLTKPLIQLLKHAMDKTYNLNGSFKPALKRYADLEGPDFYPTPAWATYALIDNENFDGNIWECACGNGAMSKVLEKTGNNIQSSDLYDRGFGDVGVNFLDTDITSENIVTNPPYNSAQGFVESGIRASKKKFALLLRLAFLEGAHRQKTIFSKFPPSRVWVFSERITFYPAGATIKGSGTTAYAWFVWDKDANKTTELRWFKPGYKSLYT
ncbi:hypothetical protein [Rhodothalassium salexigens]|uniref:hypothetical protein n=1 Tax=Rhodothalassium salexigens TaxID=1086 RepID=UPI001912B61D|nr:hypothetical protein [Rhodothalassium salexigens]